MRDRTSCNKSNLDNVTFVKDAVVETETREKVAVIARYVIGRNDHVELRELSSNVFSLTRRANVLDGRQGVGKLENLVMPVAAI